ncbi:conjugal transfer protein, partial [Streptococcus pyogenes]
IYEEDRSQRNDDGSYAQVSTGEIRGITLGIHSSTQHETLFFTVVDMSEQQIEELGLKYRDEIELTEIVVTYSAIGRNDNYRLYASGIKKKSASVPKPETKTEDKK